MRFLYIICCFLLVGSRAVFAQEVLLNGKVVDNKTNQSLIGVTVKVGLNLTQTDENGNFKFSVSYKNVIENGINFSFIGSLDVRLLYQPNHFYQVRLDETPINLNEVVIMPGDDIIKKAIQKIPINYPNKPTVIKGILRTQAWRNKSEYFKSDALLKAYIPSYVSNEKTTVSVLQNRLDTVYDKSLRYLKYSSNYNVVEFQDIAHDKYYLNQISKNKKFDYWLVGKQIYDNYKVFVINTFIKDTTKISNKISATLYIDTASYAIVAANLFRHHVRWSGALPIDVLNYQVVYDKIGNKWYLKETHCIADFVLKEQFPKGTVDFIRTEIDSINAERIPYKDIVQNGDNILLIDKFKPDLEWKPVEALIKNAANDGKLQTLAKDTLENIINNNLGANPLNKKLAMQFGRKIYEFLTHGNLRSFYGLNKTPFDIKSRTFKVSEPINYAIVFGLDARIYKSLFLGFQTSSNLWNNKKIDLSNYGFNLSDEIIFNKSTRSLTLRPSIGYERIINTYQDASIKYNSINYGFRVAYELTHKKAVFISTNYNASLKTSNINDVIFTPAGYSFGLGIVFK